MCSFRKAPALEQVEELAPQLSHFEVLRSRNARQSEGHLTQQNVSNIHIGRRLIYAGTIQILCQINLDENRRDSGRRSNERQKQWRSLEDDKIEHITGKIQALYTYTNTAILTSKA